MAKIQNFGSAAMINGQALPEDQKPLDPSAFGQFSDRRRQNDGELRMLESPEIPGGVIRMQNEG